jgi:hypothetical protein
MQDLSWADRNAAEQLDRRLFQEIDPYEVVELSGRDEVDPDEIILKFSDTRFGGIFSDAVEEMATDIDDKANPSGRYCLSASPESYTIGLAGAGDPDRILATITVGYDVVGNTLDIGIHMIFTDAEFRGEGLGHLLAGAATIMSGRMIDEWQNLHGAEGSLPEIITLWGEPVSDGGLALMEEIRDMSTLVLSDRHAEINQDTPVLEMA